MTVEFIYFGWVLAQVLFVACMVETAWLLGGGKP